MGERFAADLDLRRELDVASEAAKQAGLAIMPFFGGDVVVEHKQGDEPVTAADRASEKAVLARLERAFPDDGILSEEQNDHESWVGYRRCWVVDPLDGTRDFVAGREGFSVMIGLMIEHRPVLGVVYQPVAKTLYRAARGVGAEWVDAAGQRGSLQPTARVPPERLRLVASRSHPSQRVADAKEHLGIDDELKIGSVGVKVGLIARGERELYLNPDGNCKLWDTCAPEAIIVEAGGKMTDFSGAPLVYDDVERLRFDRGIIASNGACHNLVVSRLAPVFGVGA
ncbi:MAG: 3'(2'),5'-bisphosphate nucleotidase CysQ [Deltaproteobacteria bacterium]|nr:MAG: 3'(2'),5'-bisphosphate nucleotidase CysQ [Pseudomonadota bacterium]PIE66312.1 MAG: 3'(2'),5'-bisphosphate nucleotidase CysQ [Deltaproteobacteria bacterium]